MRRRIIEAGGAEEEEAKRESCVVVEKVNEKSPGSKTSLSSSCSSSSWSSSLSSSSSLSPPLQSTSKATLLQARMNRFSLTGLFLLGVIAATFSAQVATVSAVSPGGPSIQDSIQSPVAVVQGENAPLTCVVRKLGEATVVWKKWETGKSGPKVLTAGENRVTSDERIRVLHDEGGDVWVLAIRSAQPSDSGLYICEVNTTPVLRSFHNLTVVSLSIQPPNGTLTAPGLSGEDVPFEDVYSSYKGMGSIVGHNYTSCCMAANVSKGCLGFCTLQSILDGSTGEPTQCENEFPQIVKCMADGRDHVPCCVREGVPDICQDLCRGEYTTVTDNVKTHFSCPSYIERTLSCIADGVEILPSQPRFVDATATSSSSINVSWSIPTKNGDTVTEYIVNVTTLRSFDAPFTGLGYGGDDDNNSPTEASSPTAPGSPTVTPPVRYDENGKAIAGSSAEDKVEARMMQIKVHSDLTSTVIKNLHPFTMYEISVIAFNIHGRSLPSNKVRVLTLAPGLTRPTAGPAPDIPDIKTCCRNKGVNTPTCVTKLCDPKMTTQIEIPDLMICAPWTADVFTCLADGKDHTPCCRTRGIPAPCDDLCSGNITRLDYHYFKCLRYMEDYTNCLMEGYGVLPSAPLHLRVSNVNSDFAIIHWSPPSYLPNTVTGYNVHYRPQSTYENEYKVVTNVHSPYILESLYSNAEYEVYVEAVNAHGISESSIRKVFRTADAEEEVETEDARQNYNETDCCVKVGMSPECLPLCSYDASMSDIRALAITCAPEFHTLLRCAAGGRDHTKCCSRRGVSDTCLDVCSARVPDSLLSMAENCLPFIGNIVQCFEEGTEIIPGPVTEFHVNYVTDSKVELSWEAPEGSNVTGYQVHYLVADPSLARDLAQPSNSVNVTETQAEIDNLTTGTTYKFYVISYNEHGSSVPSSIVLVNVSASNFNGSRIDGVVSPPHSLVVATHSATWVQLVWQPPVFAHPTDKITYKVYHRSVKETAYRVNETTVNSITLDSLKPNSQYIVYVTAMNSKGESPASETLIAWTDPAHSPFVESPRIQPANMLVEGRAMTIVCVALGDPTPTISLYINGELIKQQKNRHLTQVVDNVTRDMDHVTCYADNGYGNPMETTRRIQISHKPSVSVADTTYAAVGDTAVIECTIVAHPDPHVVFWKSAKDRVPIVNGGKYNVETEKSAEMQSKYKYKLRISNVSDEDVGSYACDAENVFGEDTKTFQLQVRKPQDASGNITACCLANNVNPECIEACGFFMDIELVINKPQCLPDFDKLMKCSADGRDHRPCCSSWGVPRRCLDWCRGEPVAQNSELCVLQSTKSILKCFQDHRDELPGPPQNVRTEVLSENEVKVYWDPPLVNPSKALIYRVFWRAAGEKLHLKIDTNETWVRIGNLKAGVQYETILKAGNSHGASVVTPPHSFYTEDNAISSAHTGGSSSAGLGIGISFLVILIVAGAVAAVWFVRKRQFGTKPPGAIAFENPSYIRETNPDSAHINGDGPLTGNGTMSSVSNGVPSSGAANGWHTETLYPPRAETEVSPTLYEELRLGSEGAGFRRLKP